LTFCGSLPLSTGQQKRPGAQPCGLALAFGILPVALSA